MHPAGSIYRLRCCAYQSLEQAVCEAPLPLPVLELFPQLGFQHFSRPGMWNFWDEDEPIREPVGHAGDDLDFGEKPPGPFEDMRQR
jgi:hypothetical protein